jgi:tRNA-binding protein
MEVAHGCDWSHIPSWLGNRRAPRLIAGMNESTRPDPASIEDFDRLEIRVGTVMDAQPLPEARKPAFKLWIDFGDGIGVKQSSAQVTVHYTADQLIGRQVCAVVNFPPRRIAGFSSEVLTLGFPDETGAVVLARPDFAVPNGARLF